MALELSTLGEALNLRLRRRREEFGASLREVADWAGIPARRLREIEGGSALGSWEFEALCRGLAVDSGAVARGLDTSPQRSVARFKTADWVDPTPGDFRILSLAAEVGRIGGFLARQLDRPSRLVALRSPLPLSGSSEPWEQGYELGESARRELAPQSGPIKDLEGLLNEWGVHVARVEFSAMALDAASLWENESLPIILLNARSIRVRSTLSRRSLLAHELCHLLHDSGVRNLTTQLSWSNQVGNYAAAIEQRARAFAPAFLAPRTEVRRWFAVGPGRDDAAYKVEALARRWGFSLRGAIWHAKNCRIIQAKTAERLGLTTVDQEHPWSGEFEQGHQGDSMKADRQWGSEIAPLARGLLASLITEAATQGVISEGRGHEIITWK